MKKLFITFLLLYGFVALAQMQIQFGTVAPVATLTNDQTFTGTNIFTKPIIGNAAKLTNGIFANTLYPANEAIAFANTNQISDMAARNALVGMQNELTSFNVWSNVVDILPLYARFNPLQGNTLMGRTFTNRDFTLGNFGISNYPTSIKIPLPSMTNGCVAIVWGKAPEAATGTWESLFSLANETTSSELIYTAHPLADQRMYSYTNNVSATPSLHGLVVFPFGSITWGFPSDNGYLLEPKCDIISFNTNGNLTHWWNGIQSQVGNTGLLTNTVSFNSAFNELVIGKDVLGNFQKSQSQIAAIFVFNMEANSNLAYCVTRSARILAPQTKNLIVIGDSLSYPSFTNGLSYALAKNPFYSDYYIYNLAMSGQAARNYTDTISTNGGRMWIWMNMLSKIPGVSQSDLTYNLGINDFGNNNDTVSNVWINITNFTSRLPNDFLVSVGTLASVSTNEVLFGGATSLVINSNVSILNQIIVTNSSLFAGGVWDKASLFNQTILATNGSYTSDGVHPFGTNGMFLQRQVASLIAKNKFQTDFTGTFTGNGDGLTNLNAATAFPGGALITTTNSPSAGQVATATSASSAAWQTPSGGSAYYGPFTNIVVKVGGSSSNALVVDNRGLFYTNGIYSMYMTNSVLKFSPEGQGFAIGGTGGRPDYLNVAVSATFGVYIQTPIVTFDSANYWQMAESPLSFMTFSGGTLYNNVTNVTYKNTISVTNGYIYPYQSLVDVTNSIPGYLGTATNWWMGNYAGRVCLIATNITGGGLVIKQLAP